MKHILLISPSSNEYVSPRHALLPEHRVFMAPLGLTTVAALTPDDIDVDIWDEGVDGLITSSTTFEKPYDLFGVTGYESHIERVEALGQLLRQWHVPVVVGGPGVSGSPELYREHFDVLFIGEAEYTWPQFLADWQAGGFRPEYRQVSKVNMPDSPQPRWDKVKLQRYFFGGVQTTRGCPFDCEFCDVIFIYGRQARHKSIEQVLHEVAALERLGVPRIFLCDDNFIGNPSYGKALLKELVALNRSFRYPLGFFTQITLNVAKDDEFMALLADANFIGLFIGVETPNIESLMEANKPQNYRADLVNDIKKIQSYGIPIQAGMIVGFDHDDTTIFRQQFEFLQEAGLANPLLNVLKAPRGTKLWGRLHKEGRVLDLSQFRSNSDVYHPITNILPKQMSRLELLSGYREMVQWVRDWRNFEARIKTMVAGVRRQPPKQRPPSWKILLAAFAFVCFNMDREARRVIFRLLRYTRRTAPFMLGRVIRLIGAQYICTVQLPQVLETIDQQIRAETQYGAPLPREQMGFFIPEGFEKPYKALFPALYQHVYRTLVDKTRVQDALVELTYDFLTRWGPTFEQFEEHHREFLYELSDRTVAKENANVRPAAGQTPATGPIPLEVVEGHERQAEIRLRRLADDVLRSVQQELRLFQPAPVEDPVGS